MKHTSLALSTAKSNYKRIGVAYMTLEAYAPRTARTAQAQKLALSLADQLGRICCDPSNPVDIPWKPAPLLSFLRSLFPAVYFDDEQIRRKAFSLLCNGLLP